MSETNPKLFYSSSSCPFLLDLPPKKMQDTLSIDMVLLSPCRLFSDMLVSESSNRDIASQSIKHLEDTFSVLACKGQPFQYQLVSLYTQHTHGMMHCYKRMHSSCL